MSAPAAVPATKPARASYTCSRCGSKVSVSLANVHQPVDTVLSCDECGNADAVRLSSEGARCIQGPPIGGLHI